MENVFISAKDLKIGGIEKALIELINYLIRYNYNVTLCLEEKQGELLKELNKNIKIIEYKPCSIKNYIFARTINFLKKLKFIKKYKNKFDISISFATYLKSGSFVARVASKESILWCHADYLQLYFGDVEQMKLFFKDIYMDEFSKIVFVSKKAKENFKKIFPEKKNVCFCNNLIDYEKIKQMAKENIEIKKYVDIPIFLNISRHEEKQKRITRIIEASKKLKDEKYNFKVVLVGKGPDTQKYIDLVKKFNLQNNIIFEGQKENPYPYLKKADCVILSSDYEGYPVVFLESYIFNKPIITTDVSDYEDIEFKRGIVVSKSTDGIYMAMKEFLKKGYKINDKFDAYKYNIDVKNKLNKILKNG